MKGKVLAILISATWLSACGTGIRGGHYQEGSYQVNNYEQRLNTIDCKDSDDWYLDGYRVGKSFYDERDELLAYRVNFCEQKYRRPVDDSLTSFWFDGFAKGTQD